MSNLSKVRKVFVCSAIPKLIPAISAALPECSILEVSEQDLKSDEVTKSWKGAVLVADGNYIPPLFSKPTGQVGFVQATWAGIDPIVRFLTQDPAAPKEPELKVTRLAHPVFAQLMAEYLVAAVINNERRFHELRLLQREGKWDKTLGTQYRSLQELTVGILGVGEIGKVTAKLFKAFGCTVLGLTRSSPPRSSCPEVDIYYDYNNLATLLEASDYICSILPNTMETTDLLSNSVLEVCQERRPVLINIGRSNVISEDALIKALDAKWLSGAVLDVFDEEPLPPEHVFWKRPDIVVTPHVAAVSRPSEIAACLKDNIKKFEESQPLNYLVNWKDLY